MYVMTKPSPNIPVNPKSKDPKKRINRFLQVKSSYYRVSFMPMEYMTQDGQWYYPDHDQCYVMYKDQSIINIEIPEKEEYGIVKVPMNDNIITRYKHAIAEAAKIGIDLPWYDIDRKDNYPPIKMHTKKLSHLPKEYKEIRHIWLCDNSISILPMYSNFAVACRQQILALEPGNTEFQIDINNTKWDLKLVKETPFIYLVEDTQLHSLK